MMNIVPLHVGTVPKVLGQSSSGPITSHPHKCKATPGVYLIKSPPNFELQRLSARCHACESHGDILANTTHLVPNLSSSPHITPTSPHLRPQNVSTPSGTNLSFHVLRCPGAVAEAAVVVAGVAVEESRRLLECPAAMIPASLSTTNPRRPIRYSPAYQQLIARLVYPTDMSLLEILQSSRRSPSDPP